MEMSEGKRKVKCKDQDQQVALYRMQQDENIF